MATEAHHRERRRCFFELAVYCRQRVRERGAHNSARHDSHKRSNLPTKIFPRCLLLDISTIPLPTLCWQQTLFLQTLVRVLCRITHRYSHSSSNCYASMLKIEIETGPAVASDQKFPVPICICRRRLSFLFVGGWFQPCKHDACTIHTTNTCLQPADITQR